MNLDEKKEFPFWKIIFNYISPYKMQVSFTVCCSVFVGIAVALQPICIKWIVDAGIIRKNDAGELLSFEVRMKYALIYVGLFFFLSFFRMAIWRLGYVKLIHAIESMLCEIRSSFFKHVQGLCFRFHDQTTSGELFSYIMGSPINSIKMFLQQFSVMAPYQMISFIVAVGALSMLNWQMTLITIIIIFTIVYVNYRSKVKVKEVSQDFMKTESAVSKYVADMLRGCRAIQVHTMEENVNFSFENHIDRIRQKGVVQTLQSQAESMKGEAVQYIGMVLIYIVGAYQCIYKEMELGTFFAFVTSINVMMGPIMAMMQINLIRGNAEAGLERILRILEIQKSTIEVAEDQKVDYKIAKETAQRQGQLGVEFKNVHFSYSEDQKVLQNLSCKLKLGQSIALVGPSGSGKTTFISLLQRLYEIDSGEILLYGENIRNYNLKDLRSSFGVVSQSPFMFQGSILQNIKVTKPRASNDEVTEAIKLADADEFIGELKNGFNTQVGEFGYSLSGGQKQRVAIARAMLAKPDFLIFDEATSALDNKSEKNIQKAIENVSKGRTTFIIAHRLSTIKNVDKILVFDEGQIAQEGNFDELSQKEGLFKELLKQGSI